MDVGLEVCSQVAERGEVMCLKERVCACGQCDFLRSLENISRKIVSYTHREFRSDVWNETEINSTVIYPNKLVHHRLIGPL